jgi:hypothetical protein
VSGGASGLLGLTREVTVTRTSRFLAPPQARAELSVAVGLPALLQMSSAQMELVYDPAVLTLRGAAPAATPGRHTITLTGTGGNAPASASLVFQVIAKPPASTRLAIESAVVQDIGGAPLAVTLPPAVQVNLAP